MHAGMTAPAFTHLLCGGGLQQASEDVTQGHQRARGRQKQGEGGGCEEQKVSLRQGEKNVAKGVGGSHTESVMPGRGRRHANALLRGVWRAVHHNHGDAHLSLRGAGRLPGDY